MEEGMGAVADEYPVFGVEVVLVELLELVEELRDADDAGAANEVLGFWVDQTRWEDVKVVGHAVNDDSVAGIVAASRASGVAK